MTMSDLNYRASHRRKSASGVKVNKARPVSDTNTRDGMLREVLERIERRIDRSAPVPAR